MSVGAIATSPVQKWKNKELQAVSLELAVPGSGTVAR
jgi:hypothetical protein